MITLRPEDQEPFVDGLRQALKRNRRVMGQAPCGFGKTVCFSYIAMRARQRGLRVTIMVHRRELVDQISRTLSDFEVPHSLIGARMFYDPRQLVQVASVQTLARRLDRVHKPALAIADEGHHFVSGTMSGNILQAWSDVPTIAVSATPWRLGGGGFDLFGEMVLGPQPGWLIERGFLNRYRLFAPGTVNRDELHKRAGEFIVDEVEAVTTKPTIVGDAISHYRRLLQGAPTVAYTVSVKSAHMLAESFRAAGYQAAAVDGSMSDDERDKVIRDTRAGRLNVTTSCALIGEGLDVGSMRGAILLNPTESLGKYIQESMRPLRAGKDKEESYILDHVGNSARHGLPDDDREWTLEGRKRRQGAVNTFPTRQCPACFATLRGGVAACPCGHVFEAAPREVQQVAGELAEVDTTAARKRPTYDEARRATRSIEDLIAYGRSRGMANPEGWARHVHEARMTKRQRRA